LFVRKTIESRSPAFAEDKFRGNDVMLESPRRGISLRSE